MFTNDLRTWDIKLGRVVKWIGLCPIHSHNILSIVCLIQSSILHVLSKLLNKVFKNLNRWRHHFIYAVKTTLNYFINKYVNTTNRSISFLMKAKIKFNNRVYDCIRKQGRNCTIKIDTRFRKDYWWITWNQYRISNSQI